MASNVGKMDFDKVIVAGAGKDGGALSRTFHCLWLLLPP